ncbi:nucleolar protein 8 [Copidosoma floridanum]|uniref:nucleolar protein 8 n=1 Tax=Copidosoma floridanum TaxID=29053 RepID=UPI0006C94798|nr:nucleolar protein 8 [Copidosoma floridanum]
MEKDNRLIVKNLPTNITEAQIQDLFGQHVTVKKIDLKEKKDLENKIHKFAFVYISTTEKQLHNCFRALNGERVDGFQISVDLAKESFLEKLKRERESNQLKEEPVNTIPNENYYQTDSFNAKHKKFSDLDFTQSIQFDEKKSNKRKIEKEKLSVQNNVDQSGEQEYFDEIDKSFETTKQEPLKKSEPNIGETSRKKLKIQDYDEAEPTNKVNGTQKVSQTPPVSESERRRRESVKQKKSLFKAQEQVIRNALRSVDSTKSHNKIMFDEAGNISYDMKEDSSEKNKKNTLFSDDEDGDAEKIEWDERELEAKSKINQKLMQLQAKIGYDDRFVLDERFLEDECKEEKKQLDEDPIISDEKKWQLQILKDVLGEKTMAPSADKNVVKKKIKMIRYDPTASDHKDFEINIEKPKKEKPVKKKKEKKVIERVDEPLPEVSSEIFFDVKNLAFGNQNGGFSLLKANDSTEINGAAGSNESSSGFKFNFGADDVDDHKSIKIERDSCLRMNIKTKNSFKCNSLDEESYNKEFTKNGTSDYSHEFESSRFLQNTDIAGRR